MWILHMDDIIVLMILLVHLAMKLDDQIMSIEDEPECIGLVENIVRSNQVV